MSGIGCFIAGLLFSIFAGNFLLMMVGRVLQACGNGVLMSAAQVIILTVYPAEKKGTMMGTYGLATTAAPIAGLPLLIDAVVCVLFIVRQCRSGSIAYDLYCRDEELYERIRYMVFNMTRKISTIV